MQAFLESMSGTHMMLLGGALLVGFFLIRRTAHRLGVSRARNPHSEAKRELLKREQEQQGSIQELEVRIHNFTREAEAQIQTRLAVLAEQTKQADATIARLENKLSSVNNDEQPNEEQQQQATTLRIDQYAQHLSAAGYSAEEVALMIGDPHTDDNTGYADAA